MMSKGVPTLWSVGTPCQRAQGIVMTQLLQGNEPLQGALEVAKVSKAIVEGVLACEVPCGGTRWVGSGLSKYEGMRCTSR